MRHSKLLHLIEVENKICATSLTCLIKSKINRFHNIIDPMETTNSHSYTLLHSLIWKSVTNNNIVTNNVDTLEILSDLTRSTRPIDAKLWKKLYLWIMFNIKTSHFHLHISDIKKCITDIIYWIGHA